MCTERTQKFTFENVQWQRSYLWLLLFAILRFHIFWSGCGNELHTAEHKHKSSMWEKVVNSFFFLLALKWILRIHVRRRCKMNPQNLMWLQKKTQHIRFNHNERQFFLERIISYMAANPANWRNLQSKPCFLFAFEEIFWLQTFVFLQTKNRLKYKEFRCYHPFFSSSLWFKIHFKTQQPKKNQKMIKPSQVGSIWIFFFLMVWCKW